MGKHPDLNLPNKSTDSWRSGVEICYWRKFWGFRNEVVSHFSPKHEGIDIPLNSGGIEDIIDILEQFLNREYYEENGESIWEYEDYLIYMIRNLENLKVVKEYLIKYPETKCIFYDSY